MVMVMVHCEATWRGAKQHKKPTYLFWHQSREARVNASETPTPRPRSESGKCHETPYIVLSTIWLLEQPLHIRASSLGVGTWMDGAKITWLAHKENLSHPFS